MEWFTDYASPGYLFLWRRAPNAPIGTAGAGEHCAEMQRVSPVVETALDARATIGESPLWCAAEQALYWIDIKKPALHRFDPASGERRSWMLTSDIGGFALMRDPPGALVALRYGLYGLEFATGALSLLATSPFDPTLFRFNEAACDANGRFWIGVMFDPVTVNDEKKRGALHSYTLGGGLKAESDISDLHNGMAWSADGRTFYLSHSNDQQIFAHGFDAAGGLIGEGILFATLPMALGIPDGAAMDADGGYWSACHGGGRLRRYHPDGTVDRDIMLPVSQPTMCAFGGIDLEDLYVTSARDKLSAGELRDEPLAGAILRLCPGERGVVRAIHVR